MVSVRNLCELEGNEYVSFEKSQGPNTNPGNNQLHNKGAAKLMVDDSNEVTLFK